MIPESSVFGKILPPQRNALLYELEVPLAVAPSKIPGVSTHVLSVSEARALLQQSGVSTPPRIYTPLELTEQLGSRIPTTPKQLSEVIK